MITIFIFIVVIVAITATIIMFWIYKIYEFKKYKIKALSKYASEMKLITATLSTKIKSFELSGEELKNQNKKNT